MLPISRFPGAHVYAFDLIFTITISLFFFTRMICCSPCWISSYMYMKLDCLPDSKKLQWIWLKNDKSQTRRKQNWTSSEFKWIEPEIFTRSFYSLFLKTINFRCDTMPFLRNESISFALVVQTPRRWEMKLWLYLTRYMCSENMYIEI